MVWQIVVAKYKEYRFGVLKGGGKEWPMAKTVKDITKSFAWWSAGQPGKVKSRPYPCFCQFCRKWQEGKCQNTSYAGKWKAVNVNLQ